MTIKNYAAVLTSMTVLLIAQSGNAQSNRHPVPADRDTVTGTSNDNTRSNKDPSNSEMTADSQKNDSTDLDLAQQIRKGIMADKALSTYAHNVKVVALGGTVTLNGVVRTAEEKSKISAIAAQVAGKAHVVDELKVAPAKS